MQTWPRRLGYARPISFSSASVTDDLGTMGIGPSVVGERKYSSNEKEVPSLVTKQEVSKYETPIHHNS